MKRPVWLIVPMFFFVTVSAQIQVSPLPESGFEQRIRNFINQIRVIDTHEHLLNPAGFDSSMPDFMLLFRHYATGDLESAGMPAKKLHSNSKSKLS